MLYISLERAFNIIIIIESMFKCNNNSNHNNNNSLCFNFSLQKMSIVGILGYIILYAAYGVMMHFQSGPQDHLGWPPSALEY